MKSFALASIAAFALLAGCASTSTSTTTVTSADVAAPAAREATTRTIDVDATTHFAPPPAGDLVCHVTTMEQGTVELYVTWNKSGEGKGTLRRIAPSGNLTEQTIHAERVQGAIVADDVLSRDLVVHAAMVKEHKGKKYVRVDDSKRWVPCQ